MKKFSASSILFARVIIALAIIFWMIPPGSSLAQTIDHQNPDYDIEVSATEFITLVSLRSYSNIPGNSYSNMPVINSNGKYVAFASMASNLVSNDTNGENDVFIHNTWIGETIIVSTSSTGVQGNKLSWDPSISADGLLVAFESIASNLVGDDINSSGDIFVKDITTGKTSIVSVSSTGVRGNYYSYQPSINAEGRFVAFSSRASNLVSGDTNNKVDIFVHDRLSKETTLISVSSTGEQGNGDSDDPSISADGRFVGFRSLSTNLVSDDTNGKSDIFIHDRQTGETTRVSVSSLGEEGDADSNYPSINADGHFVAFSSKASNLVTADTNGYEDIFVHDRLTGETTLVSISSDGMQGDMMSNAPSISADGSLIIFDSTASNLVSNDTNDLTDVFIHYRQSGITSRVSVSSSGEEGNNFSGGQQSISDDGKYITFGSYSSNLVPNDWNSTGDIFLRLNDAHSISGTVLTEDLKGWGGTTILLIDANGEIVKSVSNQLNGSYSIPDAQTGTYTLKPVNPGFTFNPSFRTVSVPPDATGQDFIIVPVDHSPAENEKLTAGKVTFAWDSFPDAVSYKLQVSTNIGFSTLLLNIKVSEPTYFFDTYLPYNTTYYWKVRPIYADGKDPWLPPWQFVSMDPLAKPVLTEPAPKESVYSSEVTFRWDPVEYAAEYKVLIAKDALFAVKYDKVKTADLYATINNLPPGKYFWRVRALDPYGAKGPWSDYRMFKIVVP